MNAREALNRYLEEGEIRPAEFARRIQYDRANFHRLLKQDGARPSLDVAARIERETNGKVPAVQWSVAA